MAAVDEAGCSRHDLVASAAMKALLIARNTPEEKTGSMKANASPAIRQLACVAAPCAVVQLYE